MRKTCGLEIKPDAIDFVALEQRGRSARVLGHGSRPRDPELDLGTSVRAILQELGLQDAALRIALGTQATHLRVTSFPPMPRRDLERLITAETRKDIELLAEEMTAVSQVLPGGSNRTRVLFALTPRAGLVESSASLARAELDVELLTTSSLALFGYLRARSRPGAENCFAVLHLAAERTILGIVDRGSLRVLRDVDLGIDTHFLQPGETGSVDDALEAIARGLEATTEVAVQIRRTLEYDLRQTPDRPVRKLLLAGDATRASSIAPLLAHELKLPVELFDPIAGLSLRDADTLRAEAAVFALPIALAEEAGGREILGIGPTRVRADWGLRAAACAVAVAAVLAGAALPSQQRAEELEARLAHLRERAATTDPAQIELPAAPLARAHLARPTEVAELAARIGACLPDGARLDALSYVESDLGRRFDLLAVSDGPGVTAALADWDHLLAALSRVPALENVEVDPLVGSSDDPASAAVLAAHGDWRRSP